MDREILFRGKDDNNNWCYGYAIIGKRFKWASILPIDTIDDAPPMFDECEVELDTVGQYTGLTDKNGTKIFEGDIVKVYADCDGYYTKKQYLNGVILFDEEYFFEYKISFNHIRYCCEENIGNHRDNIEVIGNIYDNPELLEGL